MLQWAPYPFLRIALSLIAGILVYVMIGEDFRYGPEVFTFFIALFLGLYLYSRKFKSATINAWVGIAGLCCFAASGFWLMELRTPHLQSDHLINLKDEPAYYTGIVNNYVVQKPGYQRTTLAVEQVLINGKWKGATGEVQVTVPHDTPEDYAFTYGDKLLVKGAPLLVAAPLNPGQFNYKEYLQHKGIYHRQNLQAQQFIKTGNAPPNYLLYLSIKLRRYLDAILKEMVPAKREYSIASALLLGVKDDLDNAVRESYAATGTMHVLAVSGLHVGLLFGVLMLLFKSINLNQSQRLVYVLLVLGILWLYAFITGLSPSVLRAVLMFSLVAIAMVLSKRHNIYNTLAVAAFILLVYDPYYLFDVGFQLSFLAVLGIVALRPGIYNLLEVKNWFLDKVWELASIAVAAQLITLPLGIYYFHQFPVYFWLANVVVVPVATLVLYSGMLALALSWVPLVSDVLFWLHNGFIWGMNEFNLWLTSLPFAVVDGLNITVTQTWLLYAVLACILLFLINKQLIYLALATALVGVLSVQQIFETIKQQNQKQLAIYSLRGNTALSFIQKQEAIVMADSALLSDRQNYTYNIQNHLWEAGIKAPKFEMIGSTGNGVISAILPDGNKLLVWQGRSILLLCKPLRPQLASESKFDYIILTQSVRVKPETLQAFNTRAIVLDGSNKPWYITRMKAELGKYNLPIYDVTTQGALVQEL